jgi:hypothetical protein
MLKRFYKPMLFALAGCFLFGFVNVVWWSSGRQPSETKAAKEHDNSIQVHIEPSPFGNWITHDATGFFTSWLVIVALGQAGLFVWQLRYM